MKIKAKITVSKDPNKNWANNSIQFPRLLAELQGHLTDDQIKAVAEEMSLNVDEVWHLLGRAAAQWEYIKAQL